MGHSSVVWLPHSTSSDALEGPDLLLSCTAIKLALHITIILIITINLSILKLTDTGTVFSHYAKKNSPSDDTKLPTLRKGDKSLPLSDEEKAPSAGPYWSLMFEVSESAKYKPVDLKTIVEETIQGAINTQMIQSTDEIVSIYHRRLEHGYPTPSLERDDVLAEALPMLKEKSIWSRGRFGSYKYVYSLQFIVYSYKSQLA